VFVDPTDPGEIADAMCKVLEDEELRGTLRSKGILRSKSFSWEKCARETLEIIESVGRACHE
jgi:glycosyltransferase involved in cell wall biosynthesis